MEEKKLLERAFWSLLLGFVMVFDFLVTPIIIGGVVLNGGTHNIPRLTVITVVVMTIVAALIACWVFLLVEDGVSSTDLIALGRKLALNWNPVGWIVKIALYLRRKVLPPLADAIDLGWSSLGLGRDARE